MINLFKSLMGQGLKTDYSELIANGAIIIDVRSKGEFSQDYLKGSINIPLNKLESSLSSLKKDKPIILCCASGGRSASAMSILKNAGFENIYNAGGYCSLRKNLNK